MVLFSETVGLAKGIIQIKYTIAVLLCGCVRLLTSVFDAIATGKPFSYGKQTQGLVSLIFSNHGMVTLYWIMAIFGILAALATAIYSTAEKKSGEKRRRKEMKNAWAGFARCTLFMVILTVFMSFLLRFAGILLSQLEDDLAGADRKVETEEYVFTGRELSVMAKTMAVIGNYAANDYYNNDYNLNACYNEIRPMMAWLEEQGVFDKCYPLADAKGKRIRNWQNVLSTIALASDPAREVGEEEKNEALQMALLNAMDAITQSEEGFYPLESFEESELVIWQEEPKVSLDSLCFLAGTRQAAINPRFNKEPSMTDPLRSRFYSGKEGGLSVYRAKDVISCFDPAKTEFLLIWVLCIMLIVTLFRLVQKCFTELLQLVILYLAAPMQFSTWPKDNGRGAGRWLTVFLIRSSTLFVMILPARLLGAFLPGLIRKPMFALGSDGFGLTWFAKLMLITLGLVFSSLCGTMVQRILTRSAGLTTLTLQNPVYDHLRALTESMHAIRWKKRLKKQFKEEKEPQQDTDPVIEGMKKQTASEKATYTEQTYEDAQWAEDFSGPVLQNGKTLSAGGQQAIQRGRTKQT